MFKSTALLVFISALSVTALAQTTKTTTTTTVKKTTTVAKTSTTTATKKKTTGSTSKSTGTKTTPAKQLQHPTTTKTQTTTPQTTQIGEPIQPGKVITPTPTKTQPALVVPQAQQTTTTTPTNTNTGGKTVVTDGTTPQPQNGNGGKGGKGGGTDNGNNNSNNNSIINDITNGDATSAIKEALIQGIQTGVNKVSVTDGYLGNSLIKIPFPAQVSQVEETLRSFGMGALADNAVTAMNRAAESAASQAGPIFLNSIKQMNVTDAVNILSNQQPNAATQFLQRTTTESLVSAFKPSIKTALDKTLATKYWGDITTYYNKIPFVTPISTDLPDYVTRKAIDGLFVMVAQEEAKIRKDPGGQANDIIKTVFGKVKH